MYLSISQFPHSDIHPSIHPSVHFLPSFYISIHSCIYPNYISIYLSIYQYLHPFIHLIKSHLKRLNKDMKEKWTRRWLNSRTNWFWFNEVLIDREGRGWNMQIVSRLWLIHLGTSWESHSVFVIITNHGTAVLQ